MRVESLVVGGVAATLSAFAVCYAVWRDAAVGGVDWAGVIMLGSGAAICAAMELWLSVGAGVIGSRSGHKVHAQHVDTDCEFGPSRYWPIVVAIGAGLMGFVHQALWLIAAGVAAVVLTTSGLILHRPAGTQLGPRRRARRHAGSRAAAGRAAAQRGAPAGSLPGG
jgi:hypothetical protein